MIHNILDVFVLLGLLCVVRRRVVSSEVSDASD